MQVILRVGLALLIIGDLINHFFIEPAGESHSLGISMANHQTGKLNSIRGDGASRAVIFVHGFSGDRDDTWDDFPLLLGTHLAGWDIFTLGYATTLLPDVAGIWSADPDLPIISAMVRTHFQLDPLSTYESVALVAHSMGGLIVQKALVDDADLPGRTSHVLLFGTPSAGLRKASWLSFLKRQLKITCPRTARSSRSSEKRGRPGSSQSRASTYGSWPDRRTSSCLLPRRSAPSMRGISTSCPAITYP